MKNPYDFKFKPEEFRHFSDNAQTCEKIASYTNTRVMAIYEHLEENYKVLELAKEYMLFYKHCGENATRWLDKYSNA